MRTRELIPILALSAAVVFTAGCGSKSQKKAEAPRHPAAQGKTSTAAPAPAESNPASGESAKAGSAVAPAAGGKAVSAIKNGFSTDIISTLPDGRAQKGQMYSDGADKLRVDTDKGSSIIRKDKGKVYILIASNKTAMEMPIRPDQMKGQMPTDIDTSKMKKLGSETIDGYKCTKYSESKGQGTNVMWLADDIKLPIKIVNSFPQGSMTIQFKNIKVGKPAAAMFEVPKGYKINNMQDMSKNMGPRPGGMGPGGGMRRAMPAPPVSPR